MLSDIAQSRAQSLLRQRNLLAIASAVLATVATVAISAAVTRDREIVLVPTVRTPLTLTSRSVPKEYLELVTRDTALMLLNRSPEGLYYWMKTILELADPSAHGALKAELVRIVTEQRGSDVAQAFVIRIMKVDTDALSSEVTGTLKTYVGAQVIASEDRRFQFTWAYAGLRLTLTGFRQLPLKDKAEEAR